MMRGEVLTAIGLEHGEAIREVGEYRAGSESMEWTEQGGQRTCQGGEVRWDCPP